MELGWVSWEFLKTLSMGTDTCRDQETGVDKSWTRVTVGAAWTEEGRRYESRKEQDNRITEVVTIIMTGELRWSQ